MQAPPQQESSGQPEVAAWDAAIGRGQSCLRANAQRTRVRARNPARAALAALQRRGIGVAEAWRMDLGIAVYGTAETTAPRAVFAIAGEARSPELRLLYARMLPAGSSGWRAPVDPGSSTVRAERPRAIRAAAEQRLGLTGARAVMSEAFWQREVTVYTGTALVLTALGFPMTPAAFVVGGVLLLVHGAVRLAWDELRLAWTFRRIARDPDQQAEVDALARRRVVARALGLAPDKLTTALEKHVLQGDVTVPDGVRDYADRLLVDEEARVDVGDLPEPAADGGEPPSVASPGVITVVFRHKRRRRAGPAPQSKPSAPESPPGEHEGKAAQPPAKVDVDDIGSRGKDESEEIEVIEAELLDPEEDISPGRAPKG